MARRCKCGCRVEVVQAAKCTTMLSKLVFASYECQEKVAMANLEKIRKANTLKQKKQIKQKAISEKKKRAEFKKKVELSDVKGQQEKTQLVFNRVIKLEELYWCMIHNDEPKCISCSKPWSLFNNSDFAAGHYKSRGARSDLAMNNLNVYLQCNRRCNKALSGNITGHSDTHGYNKGLEMRLGNAEAGKLIEKLGRVRLSISWTGQDYAILRKWLAGRERWLRKELIREGYLN